MDASSKYVDLRVSRELHALFGMQDRINKFLWSSEAAYAYTVAKLEGLSPDEDAATAVGVPSGAWDKAASGRRHFEGSLGVFLGTLRANSEQLYVTVLVQYYAAFERYLLRRSGAYRRRPDELTTWSPLLSGLRHLGEGSYPVPLERVIYADTSRLIRNVVAHGDDAPLSVDDVRVRHWKRRVASVLKIASWPGNHEGAVEEVVSQVFGRAARMASKHELSTLYFYMLFAFTNLSALALAVEEAVFNPASEQAFTVRRQAKYVRRTELIVAGDSQEPA